VEIGGRDTFHDDVDRQEVVRTLAEACRRTRWQVHAHCLMRNHVHRVVETTEASLQPAGHDDAGRVRMKGRLDLRVLRSCERFACDLCSAGLSRRTFVVIAQMLVDAATLLRVLQCSCHLSFI